MESSAPPLASIFDVPVSLFYPMRGTKKDVTPLPIRNITLSDWLFRTSPYLLEHQRKVRSATSKQAKRRLKNAFYAIIPTGVFGVQGDSGLVEFSGFISIDVDGMEPSAAKSILGCLPYVAYVGESVSGNGVWALIRIDGMDDFKARFAALKRELESVGVEVDSSCSNPSRFRCYSYDTNAYVNTEATVFTGKYFEPKREPRVVSTGAFGDNDLRLNNLLRLVCEMGVDITGDRGMWLKLATAFACKWGEGGRSSFHDISSFYTGYSERETDVLYDSVLRAGRHVDVDVIFMAAKMAGVTLK